MEVVLWRPEGLSWDSVCGGFSVCVPPSVLRSVTLRLHIFLLGPYRRRELQRLPFSKGPRSRPSTLLPLSSPASRHGPSTPSTIDLSGFSFASPFIRRPSPLPSLTPISYLPLRSGRHNRTAVPLTAPTNYLCGLRCRHASRTSPGRTLVDTPTPAIQPVALNGTFTHSGTSQTHPSTRELFFGSSPSINGCLGSSPLFAFPPSPLRQDIRSPCLHL